MTATLLQTIGCFSGVILLIVNIIIYSYLHNFSSFFFFFFKRSLAFKVGRVDTEESRWSIRSRLGTRVCVCVWPGLYALRTRLVTHPRTSGSCRCSLSIKSRDWFRPLSLAEPLCTYYIRIYVDISYYYYYIMAIELQVTVLKIDDNLVYIIIWKPWNIFRENSFLIYRHAI